MATPGPRRSLWPAVPGPRPLGRADGCRTMTAGLRRQSAAHEVRRAYSWAAVVTRSDSTHAAAVASRVQVHAHHNFGAGGYFEEHPAPLALSPGPRGPRAAADLPPPGGIVADLLIGGASRLPSVDAEPRTAAATRAGPVLLRRAPQPGAAVRQGRRPGPGRGDGRAARRAGGDGLPPAAGRDRDGRRLDRRRPLITYGTAEQVSRDALRILGPTAALALPEAPGAGIFEQGLRLAILAFLGGGTNDVKRGLIAGGFGLA